MACPLCDNQAFTDSWLGVTRYHEQDFKYVECQSCKSLYCQPMPDAATLERMYGTDYFGSEGDQHVLPHDPNDRFAQPVAWLRKNTPAQLLDYGCGAGELLKQAQRLGWRCAGVEFDPKVAETIAQRLNVRVVTDPKDLGADFKADVLHLGDVIEHLTDLKRQMPEILKLLEPNGVLLAQGPLEANANLFTFYLKESRRLRGKPLLQMPPFHVLMATAAGQRKFFERFGLREIEFKITEVAHPAPEKIGRSDLRDSRKIGMFAVRRVSQMLTAMNRGKWGNRYFYAGQFTGN